jgi:hypothetical protein
MKRNLLFLAILVSTLAQAQIKLTYLDPTLKELKVKNYGATAVDITTYRLCSSFIYKTLNQSGITILSGDFNLATNEEVHFSWTDAGNGFTTASDDMGLYLPSGSFSMASSMVDFVEWGASGQGRENVAIAAGLWSANTFLTGVGPFEYIGNGTASGVTQWSEVSVGTVEVVINELDCDQTGTDAAEFIELYGEPNTPLDGLVIVLFNGSSDVSYLAFDLDGFSTDANGFFVLGNAGVNEVQIQFDGNSLQNGADAVVIYQGDLADWPSGTPVSGNNVVDAMVYGTNDPDDAELLAALIPSGVQLNEGANGNATGHSLSRVPNGGDALDMSMVFAQLPTPGATNVPACVGGTLSTTNNSTDVGVCSNEVDQMVTLTLSDQIGDGLTFVLTDANDVIISSSGSATFDFTALADGTYHLWSVSYTGALSQATIEVGLPVSGITGDACFAFASNFVVVTKVDCSVPVCDGGTIAAFPETTVIGLCADELDDNYSFSATTEADLLTYTYVIATQDSDIVALFPSGQYDFNSLPVGSYFVYGLSYIGALDATTTEAGDELTGIMALDGECASLSFNRIDVNVFACELGSGCEEIYISQYLEGVTGSNKFVELYNPTPFNVDLSDYILRAYNNGSLVETTILPLSGTLAAGATWVIANPNADQAILDVANVTGGVANFNGDDALVLFHGEEAIDVIGVVGETPNNGWVVGSGSTQNYSLIRKPEVNQPTTIWGLSATQWLVAPGNDFIGIGAHTAFPCGDNAYVSFATTGQQVSESVGTVQVVVQVSNVSTPFDLTVDITDGTMVEGQDFTSVFPYTINVDGTTGSYTIEVPIINDAIEEDDYEYIALGFTLNTEELTVVNDIHVISVEPSDQQYPLYSIADVTTNDVNGITDSLGVFCELRGIVHGINYNPAGLHFHLIGNDAGIKIFDADDDQGYTVTEGDSVAVRGQVVEFLGMTEFYPDTVIYLNGGNPLETPQLINTMAEDFESRMVTIECVELVDLNQWSNTGSGFDVDVTDGVNDFVVHIDLNTEFFGQNAPEGHFSLVGIGAQQDNDGIPYNSGYTIWPRYMADMFDVVTADFIDFPTIIYEADQDVTIDFIDLSEGAVSYDWNFGDGGTSTTATPSHTFTYAFLSTVSEVTVTLTVDNGAGCVDTKTHTFNVMFNSINEVKASLEVYPNPVEDQLTLRSDAVLGHCVVYDITGKAVWSQFVNQTMIVLPTSEFASGAYVIHTIGESGTLVTRFIKK